MQAAGAERSGPRRVAELQSRFARLKGLHPIPVPGRSFLVPLRLTPHRPRPSRAGGGFGRGGARGRGGVTPGRCVAEGAAEGEAQASHAAASDVGAAAQEVRRRKGRLERRRCIGVGGRKWKVGRETQAPGLPWKAVVHSESAPNRGGTKKACRAAGVPRKQAGPRGYQGGRHR